MQPQYIVRPRAYARLRLLQYAQRRGKISYACRSHGVSRTYYYQWLARSRRLSIQEHALVKRVAQCHPHWGLYRLHFILTTARGFTRSGGGLYKGLKRLGLLRPAPPPQTPQIQAL